MRSLRGIVLGALCLACWWTPVGTALGQAAAEVLDVPVMGIGDLEFYADTGGLRGPEGFTRQELFLLLDAAQLDFGRDGGAYVAELSLHAVVTDSTGRVVDDREWRRRISVADPEGLEEYSVPYTDAMGFDLSPGVYGYALTVTDTRSELTATARGSMRVRGFEDPSLAVSDVLFASRIANTEEEDGRFDKHGWRVVPNVTRTYAVDASVPFYLEIYHLSPAPSDAPEAGNADEGPSPAETLILGYTLTDTLGVQVRRYPPKRLIKPGPSVVKVDSLSLEDLPRGSYRLRVEVLDRGNRKVARVERPVFLSTPRKRPELTEDQKDQLRYYADIRYVATDKELAQYDKLKNRRARMRFLRKFWKSQDPSPGTPDNERLMEHMARMQYAENSFAAGRGKRGSDTDKGRIYIKYGPPSDIQYNLAAQTEKPFEVWTYEASGGYRFIFQDRRGAGVFELVHSTHPREMYNPNWRELQ